MCGIVGIAYRNAERRVGPETLQRMCAAIRHRGPDDEGHFVAGPVGLAMRRLSIIDLPGGRQPAFNENGSCAVVFNGEIYNYRELHRELEARGHRFRSSGDTETIVHLYEERGADCVHGLRGMFAFAVWDARTRALFLARDRFGIKPLYYMLAPWGIAFASELKALVAAPLTNRELDWDALDMYFRLGYIPAPHSPFTDVKKLEPGHSLLWRPWGSTVLRRYWDLPQHSAAAPADVEHRVLEWLDESVAAHLVSDVPVAAFLSGGLDSSAVLASAALAGGAPPPHAFTARYHGSGAVSADETELARRLAARYGAKLTVVDVRPDLRDVFEPIVQALDEPHADDSAVPTWLLSQAVGSSYKVALTGIGGDELFAGYRRHLGLLAAEQYGRLPARVRRMVAAAAARLREPRDGGLGVNRVKRFLRAGDGTTADRFFALLTRLSDIPDLYAPELGRHVRTDGALERVRQLYAEGGEPRGLAAALYLDYKTFLPDDILALSDRLAMAHSLEVRVPLVDHVLIERVFPLPDNLKVGWWRGKRLLRGALKARLPEEHFSAPKRGFVGPTGAWLRHELRETVLDELSAGRLTRLGYFDARGVARLLDDHFSRRHNRGAILWALLCFSTWHRLVVEPSVPSEPPNVSTMNDSAPGVGIGPFSST
jgi:asparagine synthase (glutamine-hydrolysing)